MSMEYIKYDRHIINDTQRLTMTQTGAKDWPRLKRLMETNGDWGRLTETVRDTQRLGKTHRDCTKLTETVRD